jgi:predicted transcriptional regulator
MDKDGKKYYVISNNLCVQYESNRNYFGVEMIDRALEKEGFKTSEAALNRIEYFHQKAITTGMSWRRDNTELIAVYFPMLLNSTEDVLALK